MLWHGGRPALVQVSEAKDLKFVGTDAFEDFYQLQQLKKGGKLQRKTGGSLLLKEKIMREAEVRPAAPVHPPPSGPLL